MQPSRGFYALRDRRFLMSGYLPSKSGVVIRGLLPDLAVMAVALFAFLRNLEPSKIVLGWDVDGSFLDAPLALHRALLSWTDHAGLGSDATPSHAAVPLLAFQALLHYLRLSPAAVEWTTFGLLFLCVPLSMLVYCRVVFPESVALRVIATLCIIFNFYHAITWYTPLASYEAGLAAALAAAAVILAFARRRTWLTALALVAVTGLTATAGSNVAVGILVALLIACLLAIALLKQPDIRARVALPLVICAALNLFWLAPMAYFFSTEQAPLRSSDYVTVWSDYALTATSEAATLPNVVRLIGTWDWTHADNHGHRYIRFAEVYDRNILLAALSFILPLLGALSLLRVRAAEVRFALLAAAVLLFLMKGTAPPLGQLYEWAYRHVPGFLIFRVPYTKFGVAAAPLLALLAGIGFSAAARRLSAQTKVVATAGVGLLIACSLSAYWSGQMFRHNDYMPNYYVTLPPSYFELARLLNGKPAQQTRAIVLPFSPELSFTALDWNFNGPDPLPYLVNRPLIVESAAWAEPYTHLALAGVDRNPAALSEAAADNAIEYAIVHRDIVSDFYNARSVAQTETLVAAAGFRRTWISQDSKLALYRRPMRTYTGIDFFSKGYLLAQGSRAASRAFFGREVFGPAQIPSGRKPDALTLVPAPILYEAEARANHIRLFHTIDKRVAPGVVLPSFAGAEVFYDGRSLPPNDIVSVNEGWHKIKVTGRSRAVTRTKTIVQTYTSVLFALQSHNSGDQLIVAYRGNNRYGATVRVVANGIAVTPDAISIDGPPHRILLVSTTGPLRKALVRLEGPDIARLASLGTFHFQTAILTNDRVMRMPSMLQAAANEPPASLHELAVFRTGGPAQGSASALRSWVTVIDRGRKAIRPTSITDPVALPNVEPQASAAEGAARVPAAGYVSLESITNDHWVGFFNGARLIKADRRGLYNAWYVPHAGLVTFRYAPQHVFDFFSRISLIALLVPFACVVLSKRPSKRG